MKKGKLTLQMYEMFGTGTACVVSPVDRILYKNPSTGDFEEMMIPTMTHKPNLMQKFYQTVVDIQVIICSLEKNRLLNSPVFKKFSSETVVLLFCQ